MSRAHSVLSAGHQMWPGCTHHQVHSLGSGLGEAGEAPPELGTGQDTEKKTPFWGCFVRTMLLLIRRRGLLHDRCRAGGWPVSLELQEPQGCWNWLPLA